MNRLFDLFRDERSLIEEIPDEEEEEDVVVDDGKQESDGAPEVKTEGVDPMVSG